MLERRHGGVSQAFSELPEGTSDRCRRGIPFVLQGDDAPDEVRQAATHHEATGRRFAVFVS
jgi:hypothetical protein